MSVDAIVELAKVNKRMVYHYFGSKDALFEAALVEVDGRIESIEFHALELGRNPAEKLARLWESYFAFLDDEPEFTRLLQWENLEKRGPPDEGESPTDEESIFRAVSGHRAGRNRRG